MTKIGDVSFWYADIGLPQSRRTALSGDTTADVAIIGAGYTGLWTAYYLKKARPGLNVLVIEKEFAGFGASGRNGGWLMGTFAWNHERYAARTSRAAVHRAHMINLQAQLEHHRDWGDGHRMQVLSAAEAKARINVPGALGGLVMSGMARVQPAKLVRGLADAVERLGVRIVEGTEVLEYGQGLVKTTLGQVKAPVILRATEGFTATIKGHKRDWLPLNSAQIATPVLPPEVWDQIGWQGHELFHDFYNSYCYCQRTREGRITVGARGVPYLYGSAMDRNGAPDSETVRRLTEILHRYFPAAIPYGVDHAWCGVIGVPRDWCATVGLDPATGLGWAGGYVGVGVSTANLAGQTLADLTLAHLALGEQTRLTGLPWVNRQVRKWEPEPLRWLGVHTMYRLFGAADFRETLHDTPPSRLAALGNWLTGR
jgi:glycine/D-amino acid oxidase-like deaminating enzyme